VESIARNGGKAVLKRGNFSAFEGLVADSYQLMTRGNHPAGRLANADGSAYSLLFNIIPAK
jgi:hypothetical protein